MVRITAFVLDKETIFYSISLNVFFCAGKKKLFFCNPYIGLSKGYVTFKFNRFLQERISTKCAQGLSFQTGYTLI